MNINLNLTNFSVCDIPLDNSPYFALTPETIPVITSTRSQCETETSSGRLLVTQVIDTQNFASFNRSTAVESSNIRIVAPAVHGVKEALPNLAPKLLAEMMKRGKYSEKAKSYENYYSPTENWHNEFACLSTSIAVLIQTPELQHLAMAGRLALIVSRANKKIPAERLGVGICRKPTTGDMTANRNIDSSNLLDFLTLGPGKGLGIREESLRKILPEKVIHLLKIVEIRIEEINPSNRELLFWMQSTALMSNFAKNSKNAINRLKQKAFNLESAQTKTVTCACLLVNCASNIRLAIQRDGIKHHARQPAASSAAIKKVVEMLNGIPTSSRMRPASVDFIGLMGINVTNEIGAIPRAPKANHITWQKMNVLVKSLSEAISANF